MARLVQCTKFGKELPGLDSPPFPGALGQRIFESVSKEGWELWAPQGTLIINHYGLNLADKEHRAFLRQQMEEFFFGEGAQLPEDWTPDTVVARK